MVTGGARFILKVIRPVRGLFLTDRCIHLSHRALLPCWREAVYDGFCAVHNNSCMWDCE